jgi:Putative peptidoglycan binding domain
MKIRVALVVLFPVGIVSFAYGQPAPSAPSVPATSAAPAPVASAPPSQSVARPQKNQGRGQKRKDAQQQQQPDASVAPNGNQQRNTGPRTHQQNPKPHDASRRQGVNYAEAIKRQHHQRHDRPWWKNHYITIVFVTGQGYYYWDAGYWFPALGFDPRYETYEYNGPIYTYGDLLPDQVIYNVQRALKDLGYYSGNLSGSMSAATINAISAFQGDNGLDATGAIDEPTVEALGLY